jgi:hypothetical protein
MSRQKLQGFDQRVRHYLQVMREQLPSLRDQRQVDHNQELLQVQGVQTQDVRHLGLEKRAKTLCALPHSHRLQEVRGQKLIRLIPMVPISSTFPIYPIPINLNTQHSQYHLTLFQHLHLPNLEQIDCSQRIFH